MKKSILTVLLLTLLSTMVFAQDVKEAATKMDQFSSKTGTILKFIDYDLTYLLLTSGTVKCKIRKIVSANETGYFLQISNVRVNDTKTASIAYEDLIEVIKALKTLKLESSTDLALNPNYLENKFITEDGFQIGYYVSKGKLNWYLTLEKYGSGNTIYLRDVESIEVLLNSAKSKIEEMK